MSQKKFLDKIGLQNFLNRIKALIPTKTSELQNDSGFITSEGTYDSALSLESEKAVQNKVVTAAINGKQDSLSTAQTNAVNSGITSAKVQGYDSHISDTDIHVTQADKTSWDSKASGTHTHLASEVSGLSTVATSGSYNDLSNKPSIPSKTSDLTNDSGFLTSHNPIDSSLSSTSTNAVQNKVINTELGKKANTTDLATVATSGSYADLTNKPTIPTVNNATLTIQKNGTTVKTFTANSSTNVTADITVPTKVSELTNDSGFLTSHNPVDSALSTTSENAVQNKVVKAELDNKANSVDLSTVATTGSYTDLNNIPSNFTPASHTHGSITNDGKLGTASRALITDGNKKIAVSSVTSTELGYLSGVTSAVQDQLDGKAASTHSHTASEVSGLATVATSGSYNDLTNKPTIPTVNNATLTIQKNGTTVKTFTANASSNVTANITVPTKVSELTNDSGFLTSHNPVDSALSDTSTNAVQNKVVKGALDGKSDTGHTHTKSEITDFPTLATVATSGSYNDLTNKPTIPTVNNATLTIQKNGSTVKTFTANASSNVTANITVPTKVSELTNDSGFLTSASNLDSSKLTGTIDIARLPKGALERLVTVADQTARFALTTSDVQLGDTVKQLDTGVMYIVTDETKLSSADGYTEYTAGAATSVPWSGVTGKPSSYTPASHSHGNIANGGTLGTASRALITDGNKKITTSSVTSTELGYLSGVTSAVQTQLNGKAASSHTHTASEVSGLSTVATSGSYNDLSNKPTIDSALSSTSTNAVQNKVINSALAGKAASSHTHTKSQITDFPTKTSQFTNDSHQTITVGTDTTSTASPAHSGTFTCIDSVTRDSNGHVTAVNTKTVTLPSDNNTDTLVTQNVSTANENHPVLLTVTKDATSNQGAKTSIFASGVKVNPSTNTVTATTFSGALSGNASTATQFSANKSVTLTGDVTGTASSKAGWSVATTLSDSGVTAGTYGPSADVTGNNNATISVPEITVDSKGRVTSVANRTLTCKNNTYNVYNKTLTIQKNGTSVATFTSNSNTDVTANITVPTKTSELDNDSGFLTSHQDLSLYPYKVASFSNYGNGRWPYIDLGDTTTHPNGFNEIVATGKYQVRWTNATTVGVPFTTSAEVDCILEVDGTSSASGVSSYQRVVQRIYRHNSPHKVYFRYGAYHDGTWNWSDWTSYGDIVTHNASEFLTSHQSLANYSTLANTVKSLSISGKTITVIPGSGSAYTLTTQDTVYTHPTTTGNKHIPSGGSSGQFLGWASDGTAKWVNNPNTNTDTLMTQNVSTTNATYPILLTATADATANLGAKAGIFGSGVKVNPSTSIISASGFSGLPSGTAYVTAVKDGGALINSQPTSFGAVWCAPTKNYRVASATFPGNNDTVYICYSVTNENVSSETNTIAKSLTWTADTGTLTANAFSGALTGNVTGNCSGSSGSCTGNAATATQFSANTTVALTGDATGTSAGSKKGWSVPVTLANSGVTAGTYGPSADVTGNNNATISVPEITVDAKGRVTSVVNRTLTCKNNTYTVNNATLTIQKNGTNVATFTSNASANATANITVPTKVSELDNDSGFLTSHQDLSLYPFKMYSTSNGGIFEYADLADEDHIEAGFGGFTTTGIYRVRTTSAVPDAPTTSTTDGNLIVINSGAASGVSSNRRCKQIFINNSRYGGIYYRTGTYTTSSATWTWYDWVQDIDNVSTQDISGIKTFKSHLRFSSTNTRGTAPSSREERDLIDYKDSAGNRIFLMDTVYNTDKSSTTSLLAYNTTVATGANIGGITIGCDASGKAYTTAITPDASDDSTKIATTAWVNAKGYLTEHQSLSNYVTLDTEQAITGTKHTKTTYTDVMPKTVTFPSSTRYYKSQRDYAYNDETLSLSYGFVQTNGTNVRRWYVYPYSSGDTAYFQIDVNADASDSNFKIRTKTVIPASTNETDLGTSSKIWKSIYANNYYLGTTAFGDIVTHNASEFLTSHQSLANYSTLANTVKSLSISGKTITVTPGSGSAYTLTTQDTVYTHPTTAGNKHIPSGGAANQYLKYSASGTAVWADLPSIPTKTSDLTNDSHQTIATTSDTTSTDSPTHSGTFTCIDSVTRDSNGHVTTVNTKTVTLPADSNTDTKVTQTVTTGNSNYPIILGNTASQTATETSGARFTAGAYINARYATLRLANVYNSDALKGTRPASTRQNLSIQGYTKDDALISQFKTEMNKAGLNRTFIETTNWIKDGAVATDGTATTCGLYIDVLDNGTKQISTTGLWASDLTPVSNNSKSLGTSDLRWKECYANAYFLGTTAFGDIVTHNASEFLTSHQSLAGYLPLTGGTMTGDLTIKGATLKFSSLDTTEGSTTYRTDTLIKSVSSNTKYGLNVLFGSSGGAILGAGEGKDSLLAELAGTAPESVYIIADDTIHFHPGANTYANKKTVTLDGSANLSGLSTVTATTFSGNLTGNCSGTSANVTGTVAIANGGTGATDRLNAFKNLTSEAVSSPTHFIGITSNWAKVGYTTIAQAKSVLGVVNVTQTVTSNDSNIYPLLLGKTAGASATSTTTARFHPTTGLKTDVGVIYTGNSAVNITKGYTGSTVDQGGICTRLGDGVTSVGWLKWTTETNGGRYCYISSRNYIKNGAPAADGSEVGCSLVVGVTSEGKKYISATVDYDTNDNSVKVATTEFVRSAIPYVLSGGASASAGGISPVNGTIILGGCGYTSSSAPVGTGITVSGNKLSYAKIYWDATASKLNFTYGDNVGSGTWKLMGGSSTPPTGTGWSSAAIVGLWVKIAS